MIETLGAYDEALDRRPDEIVEARRNGNKVVGIFCCYTPVEIVHALGLIPVRLGWGGDDSLAEDGIEYITNIQCPYVRQTIGVFKEGKNPYAVNTDLVAISAVCLQEYRMVEVLKYYFGKETLTLSVPKNFYLPEGQEFFLKELESFTGKLEIIAGRKLDQGQLRKSVALYAEIRKKTAELYEFLLLDNSPIRWGQILKVIHAGFYLAPETHLSLLKKLNQELKAKPVSDKVKSIVKVRLLLAGSIIAPGNTKIIDVLEGLGGTVVADDICTGQRTFAGLVVKEPTLAGLAKAYLDRTPCAAQLYPTQETDKRLINLFDLIDRHRADAVLYHTIRFCDPYTFRVEENKALLDAREIPFLQLHTDYGVNDIGQLQTRIQALVEIIKRKKKEAAHVGSQAAV